MSTLRKKHIKFLIVDSINDDLQGLYEINWVVNSYYPKLNTDIIRQRNNALIELLTHDLVKIVWMSNPKFEVMKALDMDAALKVIENNDNWINFDLDCIYGVMSSDTVKTIQLENDLYHEIKELHNRTKN